MISFIRWKNSTPCFKSTSSSSIRKVGWRLKESVLSSRKLHLTIFCISTDLENHLHSASGVKRNDATSAAVALAKTKSSLASQPHTKSSHLVSSNSNISPSTVYNLVNNNNNKNDSTLKKRNALVTFEFKSLLNKIVPPSSSSSSSSSSSPSSSSSSSPKSPSATSSPPTCSKSSSSSSASSSSEQIDPGMMYTMSEELYDTLPSPPHAFAESGVTQPSNLAGYHHNNRRSQHQHHQHHHHSPPSSPSSLISSSSSNSSSSSSSSSPSPNVISANDYCSSLSTSPPTSPAVSSSSSNAGVDAPSPKSNSNSKNNNNIIIKIKKLQQRTLSPPAKQAVACSARSRSPSCKVKSSHESTTSRLQNAARPKSQVIYVSENDTRHKLTSPSTTATPHMNKSQQQQYVSSVSVNARVQNQSTGREEERNARQHVDEKTNKKQVKKARLNILNNQINL